MRMRLYLAKVSINWKPTRSVPRNLVSSSGRLDVSGRFVLERHAFSGTMSKFRVAREIETGKRMGLKLLDAEKTKLFNDRADWADADWSDTDPTTPPCETTPLGDGHSEVSCTVQSDSFYLTSTGIGVEISA